MANQEEIKKLVLKMTNNTYINIKNIKKVFEDLTKRYYDEQSLLHLFVDKKYDELNCFLAIKALLEIGLDPNLEDGYKYNFIQTALCTGYSERFILNIINESLKYNLDVNHVDCDGDSILHTAIYTPNYKGKIENIYELLCNNGYLISQKSYDLTDATKYIKTYSKEQIENLENKIKEMNLKNKNKNNINKNIHARNIKKLSEKEISDLEKFGKILNNKRYVTSPTVGREKELMGLMITLAQDKKNPIIVGESGVGKTALVDELAYRIINDEVPNFLKDKILLEVNPVNVVAGTKYRGDFEENMNNLMKLCEKYDIILFIDEIHSIYGVGATKEKDIDMASILKLYIDRSNEKIIGTTTNNEYDKYFSQDALKRRFERINVLEPNEDVLYKIINKVIEDYCIKNKINFENEGIKEQIIDIIIDSTNNKARTYNDKLSNPDLSISIVDKAFAFVKVFDSNFITEQHFIESFKYCDRIYETIRQKAINRLKNLDTNISKPVQKVIKIDFNKVRV